MQQATLRNTAAAVLPDIKTGRQVRFGEPIYNDIAHGLIEEAQLLDSGQFKEWLEFLADDVQISMAVRQTVRRPQGDGRGKLYWLYDDKNALTFKAMRYLGDSAWEDDPPSRIRRMVTNIRVHETAVIGEYLAQSYLLLLRNTGDQHHFSSFSACREDILRRSDTGLLLGRREILIDQAVIGMSNLGFML